MIVMVFLSVVINLISKDSDANQTLSRRDNGLKGCSFYIYTALAEGMEALLEPDGIPIAIGSAWAADSPVPLLLERQPHQWFQNFVPISLF